MPTVLDTSRPITLPPASHDGDGNSHASGNGSGTDLNLSALLAEKPSFVEDGYDLPIRWTRWGCDRLERLELMPPHYELINGVIISKSGENPRFEWEEPVQWQVDECEIMENAGLLPEKWELLEGVVFTKMGQYSRHGRAVMYVIFALLALFGKDRVLTQTSVKVQGPDGKINWPEPDVYVLREGWSGKVPAISDILLAVEVTDTTAANNYETKRKLYARAGVGEYWIVDVNRRVVTTFTNPDTEAGDWHNRTEYGVDDGNPIAFREHRVAIADLLPEGG